MEGKNLFQDIPVYTRVYLKGFYIILRKIRVNLHKQHGSLSLTIIEW